MKLRILDNSIRLRLRRSEVEQLADSGRVEASCDIGGHILHYALTSEPIQELRADFHADTVTVRVPSAQVHEWAASRTVSVKGQMGSLSLLVEKDFTRSAVKEPDDHDRYANPRASRVPPPAT